MVSRQRWEMGLEPHDFWKTFCCGGVGVGWDLSFARTTHDGRGSG